MKKQIGPIRIHASEFKLKFVLSNFLLTVSLPDALDPWPDIMFQSENRESKLSLREETNDYILTAATNGK